MTCKNHPDVAAGAHCAGCAEPFCGNCLIEINGQIYCGSCKVLALKGKTPSVESVMRVCLEAKQALIFAGIGIFCGFILGPVALIKVVKAKGLMAEDPKLLGSGMANGAIILGVADLVRWIAGIVTSSHRLH